MLSSHQKKIHAQALAQAKLREEELLSQVNTLQTKNVELETITNSHSALMHRYKSAMYEIEDLKREHEYEKEQLLESVRDQTKEIDFYEEVLGNILSPEEIQKIRSHTVWSENLSKYKIPPFLFKEKTIKFPNLTYAQSQGLNNQTKQLRELEVDCGLIEEEDSGESEWSSECNYEAKKTQSLAPKKNKALKLEVKPIKTKEEKKKDSNFPSLFEKKKFTINKKMLQNEDLEELSLQTPIEKKKNFLRTIDTGLEKLNNKINLFFL